MLKENLNNWLAVVTNVGLILGLLLVAYQVNQTNLAMDRDHDAWITSMTQATQQMWVDLSGPIADREPAELWWHGISGEELDPVDEERFYRLAQNYFVVYQGIYTTRNRISPGGGEFAARHLATEMLDRPGLRRQFQRWTDLYGSMGGYSEKVSRYLEQDQSNN